jgi:hypothetical protein
MIKSVIRLKAFVLGNLALAFGLAFLGLTIVAASMLAGQCYAWLKHGYWEPYPVLNLLLDLKLGVPKAPRLSAVPKLTDLILSLPAMACLAAAAGLCFLIGGFLMRLANPGLHKG